MIALSDIEAAAARIAPHIRRTPSLKAACLSREPQWDSLWFKLECLQVTGSFKARGATNRLFSTPKADLANGIVTASGGNHGLAVARAARLAGIPAFIFVPANVAPAKLGKLEQWGATTKVVGDVWDETNAYSLQFAKERGAVHFHPFKDAAVVAGQGTVALEVVDEFPDVDTVLIAVGGGGLIAGMSVALKAKKPGVRVIGIEAVGSPSLKESLESGTCVRLPQVTTRVATMSCAETDPNILSLAQRNVDEIVLVSDDEMQEASRWLWFEFGLATDLSGAATVAALLNDRVRIPAGQKTVALVCGAGNDGIGS